MKFSHGTTKTNTEQHYNNNTGSQPLYYHQILQSVENSSEQVTACLQNIVNSLQINE